MRKLLAQQTGNIVCYKTNSQLPNKLKARLTNRVTPKYPPPNSETLQD